MLPVTMKRRLPLAPTIAPPVIVSAPAVAPAAPTSKIPTTSPFALPVRPAPGGSPSTSVSGPTLPVPGHSGLGWVRDATPIGRVAPTASPKEGTGAPAPGAGQRVGTGIGKRGAVPIGRLEDAGDPNAPTTAEPLHRFGDIASRHGKLYPRAADLGGFRPWQGIRLTLPNGAPGGVPQLPKPVLWGVEQPSPAEYAGPLGRIKYAGLRRSIEQAQRLKKRFTNLSPGVGGLDIAMGDRFKPGTPSGVLGKLRDIRAGKWRQSFPDGTVPKSVIETLGRMRAANPVPVDKAPESTPVDQFSAPGAAAPPSYAVTPLQDVTGIPQTMDEPTPQPKVNNGLLIAAAVLALVFVIR